MPYEDEKEKTRKWGVEEQRGRRRTTTEGKEETTEEGEAGGTLERGRERERVRDIYKDRERERESRNKFGCSVELVPKSSEIQT